MTVRVTREAEPQIELYGAYSGELVGGGKRTLTFTPTGTYLTMVVKNSLSKVQVEQGGFKTSYIPTTGATATRAADVASIPVSAFGYNQKAGSIYVDGTFLNGDTIVTLGSTAIAADADGAKDYTVTYSADPSATGLVLNQGTYLDVKYYPRRLTNAQLQELTT